VPQYTAYRPNEILIGGSPHVAWHGSCLLHRSVVKNR
jgi:hypothetical protein